MLRILQQPNADSTVVLRLEGKLLAAWIPEVDRVLAAAESQSRVVAIDLARLGYADAAGVNWLRRMKRRGFAVTASGYLTDLLSEDAP